VALMDQILSTIFKKQPRDNPLVTASLYSFQLLSQTDSNIWKLAYALMSDIDPSIEPDLHLTLVILYCIYNSTNIIYNLPSMLNKPIVNGKPSLHIVFGENVSQLVSVSLIAEAFCNLSKLQHNASNNTYLDEFMKLIYQEYDSLQQDSQILAQLDDIQRDNITHDYNLLRKQLFVRMLESVFILAGWKEEQLLDVKKYLEQMWIFISNHLTIPNHLLLQFCQIGKIDHSSSKFIMEITQTN
jgi:hypothetical protein